jgi:hypothetical protein
LTQAALEALTVTYHITSILQSRSPGPDAAADVTMDFFEAASCVVGGITLVVTT